MTRYSKSTFIDPTLPTGSNYSMFMEGNLPTQSTFQKLFDSIPFLNSVADTATEVLAGHSRAATIDEVKARTAYTSGNRYFVQPAHLPLTAKSLNYDSTNNVYELVNDNATPGTDYYYGTQLTGTKGWKSTRNLASKSIDFVTPCFELVNDVTSPGNNRIYGTTGAGVKGWIDFTSLIPSLVTVNDSLIWNVGNIHFVGDILAPGNNYVYGTNGAGTKTWYTVLSYLQTLIPRKNSIEYNALELQLVGDVLAPGNNYVYGTNGAGTKSWYTVASYLATLVPRKRSIIYDAAELMLDGDIAAPGNYYLYGTNAAGAKSWYTLATYIKNSIVLNAGQIQLDGDNAAPGAYYEYRTNVAGTKGWVLDPAYTAWTSDGANYVDDVNIYTIGGVNVISLGTHVVRYKIIGKMMYIKFHFHFTNTGAATEALAFTIPPIAGPNVGYDTYIVGSCTVDVAGVVTATGLHIGASRDYFYTMNTYAGGGAVCELSGTIVFELT